MIQTVAAALEAALPDVEAAIRLRLERFVDLLVDRNETLNVTGARTAEAYAEHVRDSLVLAPFIGGPLIDVGSGGGFPAIPLAIVTGTHVTLIESVAKKARFLRETVGSLGLPAVVIAERAEAAAGRAELREAFACATARAVGPATTVLELVIAFLRVGGVALLQRGGLDQRERSAVADAALILGAELVEERLEPAPADASGIAFDEGRRVLVLRKLTPTPRRFPRRAGVPAKRPLCFEEPR